MKIVICEDDGGYREALCHAVERWKRESGHAHAQVMAFASSEDLLEQLEKKMDADLLFIDIEIPGEMSGMEMARRIRENHLDVTIVFCTNYSEYVYEGYTVNALRYLKKPASQADVSFCCEYVYRRLAIASSNAMTITSANRRYVLRHSEIRFMESRAHTLHIHTTLQKEPLRVSLRLSDVMADLPQSLFVFCHRSYAVNVAHIRMMTRSECRLLGGEVIPISRTCMADVARAFDAYHQGMRGEVL